MSTTETQPRLVTVEELMLMPDENARRADPSRGWVLIGLSVATSIDAFGAGIGMQLGGANVWVASAVIGVVTAALTFVGAKIGAHAEHHLGRKAEFLGGAVLVALGFKMLQI